MLEHLLSACYMQALWILLWTNRPGDVYIVCLCWEVFSHTQT